MMSITLLVISISLKGDLSSRSRLSIFGAKTLVKCRSLERLCSTVENVQYCWGYHQYYADMPPVL